MSEQLVEVKDLKVTYYQNGVETPVVRNVSFEIKKNETLGLVGESGSGKSVTSKAIMRLIAEPPGKIANGEILFEGKNLLKMKEKQMQKVRGKDIAMIFQEPMTSLNPYIHAEVRLQRQFFYIINAASRKHGREP